VPEPRVFHQVGFRPPPGATELFLVRHGQSEPILEGGTFPLLDGQDDPALSAEGRTQAERVCERLAADPPAAVYVTPLRRTVETATPLLRRLSMRPVVDADLREVFFGEWEGGPFRQKMADRDPIALRMLAEERFDVIPGAESAAALTERLRGAVLRIAAAHPGERVVSFGHGGTIATILAIAARSRPFAFLGADNASISHLVLTPERWIVRGYNDTAHLSEPATPD